MLLGVRKVLLGGMKVLIGVRNGLLSARKIILDVRMSGCQVSGRCYLVSGRSK